MPVSTTGFAVVQGHVRVAPLPTDDGEPLRGEQHGRGCVGLVGRKFGERDGQ